MTAATGTSVRHDLGDSLPSTILHYIDGEHVASADNATIPVTDPVGHEEYCTLASGGAADIDRAVAAPRRAFLTGPWVGLSARRRSQTLNAIADAIEARADLLSAFESFDTGLPISQAHGMAARAAENFRFFADICGAMHEDAFRTNAQIGYSIRRPRGVAGLITPWNVPFMLATWKLAPCLAAGCTVVLKPAELSPCRRACFPRSWKRRVSRRACSTWSTGSVRRRARRLSHIPTFR